MLQELATSLAIGLSTVRKRLKTMGMIQKQGYWVPYESKLRDIERRFLTCELLLERQIRKGFLHRIVTGDEKWIHYDNPKHRKSWVKPGQPSTSVAKQNTHGSKFLICIWEFEVSSRHFPGQTHVWRVAGWLQRGRARARQHLHWHMARAAALLVVTARDRLTRDTALSLRAGGAALLLGLHRLLDLLFGMPSLAARDLEKKIREERSRYLVAELVCKPEYQEDIAALAAWVTRAMRRAASEKADAREQPRAPPPVPCLYTTPRRIHIDLRLYRREILRRAAPALQAALGRESRGWFLHFRERLAADLARQKMPPHEIEQEVRLAGMREYVSRVSVAVRACPQLAALGDGVPDLLADQLQATAIMNRAEENVRRKLAAGLSTAEARIAAKHPILSRADAWRRERAAADARRLSAELRWAALEDAAAAAHAHKLHQHRYFLLRDLAFLRDREPLLLKELRAAKAPTREFSWATRIWRPSKWAVTRHFRGRSERIPTVLSNRATSIVTPRSDPSQPVFLVDKERVRTTTTRWPAWRLANLAHRAWCWSWNMMFLLGVVVPWCSPLSLRTLLCMKPFVPDYELSQVNGTLFPKRSSETQSMWSRLLALWRHVSKERTRFETEPDTGLLGKGLSRLANRLWNYGVVGGLGSAALLLISPLAAGLTSLLSLVAAATVLIWMPAMALLLHASNMLIYDLDSPDPAKLNRWFALFEAVVWQIITLGVLQPLLALFVALVVCPIYSLVLLVGGVVWWSLRSVWEEVAWRALIRRAARVPAHDSAFCKRVDGPGLRDRFYYQITSAQALAAVCARAELERLGAWAARVEAAIERPLHDYRHFVDACFGPFSVQIAKQASGKPYGTKRLYFDDMSKPYTQGSLCEVKAAAELFPYQFQTGAYKQLEKECAELTSSLREKVAARRRDLALGLSDTVRARVRMEPADLKRAIRTGARELAAQAAQAGEARGAGGSDWWAARGLAPADWHGLAANMLLEVFDAEVLVALDEREARLPLEGATAPGTTRWAALVEQETGAPPALAAPPDVLGARADWPPPHHTEEWDEWGSWCGCAAPRVPPPSLEVGAFSPRGPLHPPVPHPATVALVLHNREAESPVPLESEVCADVLRALEDAAAAPDTDCRRDLSRYPRVLPKPYVSDGVERYRGGGGAAGSEAGTSDGSDCTPDLDDERPPTPRGSGRRSSGSGAGGGGEAELAVRATGAGGAGAACRWTLTGRGVRLRADLASPEDVTLDTDRHMGTSV
ncbi:Mariner Mos1 transposase [Eumeta japonica]|uniref:Mariner Mos1 transposase n=1 Tax=Eumeta variegata TaxID=151549 RepID=A0A4C1VMJ1_EUMVA|nr:Mariner Mos1 transposase [Eumeta japonica]